MQWLEIFVCATHTPLPACSTASFAYISMILLIILPVLLLTYIIFRWKLEKWIEKWLFRFRQLKLYYTLYKCGLNPQFDIFGLKGLLWLDSSVAHENFTQMCSVVGDKTFSVLRGATLVVVTNDVDLIHLISTEHFGYFHSRIVSYQQLPYSVNIFLFQPEIFSDDPITADNIHMFAAKGERWKRLRTLTSFGLSTVKLKLVSLSLLFVYTFFCDQLFPTIETCVSEFLDHVNSLSDGRNIVIDHSHRFEHRISYF